jgi:hypothetical protein
MASRTRAWRHSATATCVRISALARHRALKLARTNGPKAGSQPNGILGPIWRPIGFSRRAGRALVSRGVSSCMSHLAVNVEATGTRRSPLRDRSTTLKFSAAEDCADTALCIDDFVTSGGNATVRATSALTTGQLASIECRSRPCGTSGCTWRRCRYRMTVPPSPHTKVATFPAYKIQILSLREST